DPSYAHSALTRQKVPAYWKVSASTAHSAVLSSQVDVLRLGTRSSQCRRARHAPEQGPPAVPGLQAEIRRSGADRLPESPHPPGTRPEDHPDPRRASRSPFKEGSRLGGGAPRPD